MKYAVLCVLLGIVLVFVGIARGGVLLVVAWLGISFLVLGVGHAGIGAKVLAKRESGTIALWARVIHLPLLLLTSAVWHVTRLVSREAPYNDLPGNIVIGRRLLAKELPAGVESYVDLTAEFVAPRGVRSKVKYICLPILDGGVPGATDLGAALAAVDRGKTYVHCAQGHGRTALFALALLARRGIINDYEEGMRLLKTHRPGVRLNAQQERFIRAYMERIARH